MLAVGTVFYNDAQGLERLIESCWKNVDLIFCIDGPFRDFNRQGTKKAAAQSTDGSREIIKRFPNTILIDAPHLLEHEKRQVYLDLCKQYNIDYLIIIDADEYFSPDCNWEEFAKEREQICNNGDYIFNLKNYTEMQPLGLIPLDQARLWKNPGKLEYLNFHHYQFSLRGTGKALVPRITLYSVKLCHDPMSVRSDERHEQHHKYIKWLEHYEKKKMRNESKKDRDNRLASVWAGN